ncbi:hypothetical protein [Undibacterium sp. SXout20W]|uniref:hypothetical protein n=1 Tax=Undibacterium sp. SXout20W TaxID=3413051 RepID=UPI003BF2F1E4
MDEKRFNQYMYKITSTFCLISILSFSFDAYADVYQCEKGGHIQFTQSACTAEQKQIAHTTVSPATSPSKEERQAAIARDKNAHSELNRLQKQRIKDEEKQDKATAKQLTQLTQLRQRKAACDKAQLQVKWAHENAANASIKTENKAKLNLKRAKEKAELICKAY